MVRQHAFTFLASVPTDRVASLRKVLDNIQSDVEENQTFPFMEMEKIHFARFLVLDELDSERRKPHSYPTYLVFSTNFDGDLDDHLSEIIEKAGEGFHQVFGHCHEGPDKNASVEERVEFLKKHSDYRAFFYIGTWGLSVARIRHEEVVRQKAELFLDKADREATAWETWETMVSSLNERGQIRTFDKVILPQFTRPRIIILSIIALILLPIWLPLLLILGLILYVAERFERPFEFDNLDLEKTQDVANQEDQIVQNQLTHLVEIKYSFFRGLIVQVVLSAIQLLSVFVFNKGKLGNIPTIHFARWLRIDRGKRLLFFSNYDGSWESYLGDFIDKASLGLTGVWSNTRWFPRTLLLLFRGARDEQRFKAWTRAHQIYTDVWYSAYKTLSVRNILNNSRIYEGLQKSKMTEEEAQEWLSLFN